MLTTTKESAQLLKQLAKDVRGLSPANAINNGVYHNDARPARGPFILLRRRPEAKVVVKPKLAAPSAPLVFEDAPAILTLGCTGAAPLVRAPKALLGIRKIHIRRGSRANVERLPASPIPHNAQLFNTSIKQHQAAAVLAGL